MSPYRPQRGRIPFSSLGADRCQRFHVEVSFFTRFLHRYLSHIFIENFPKLTLNYVHPSNSRIFCLTIYSTEYTTRMPIRIGGATYGRAALCLSIRWSWATWSCSTSMFKTRVSQLVRIRCCYWLKGCSLQTQRLCDHKHRWTF